MSSKMTAERKAILMQEAQALGDEIRQLKLDKADQAIVSLSIFCYIVNLNEIQSETNK